MIVRCARNWKRSPRHAQTVSERSHSLKLQRAAAVADGVRALIRTVARGVTDEGPAAWRKRFADSPSFFMALDGRLVYLNGAAAVAAIPDLARTIQRLELRNEWRPQGDSNPCYRRERAMS